MANNIPLKMRGVIVGEAEGGWTARMTHPERVDNVFLPIGELCLTRQYPNVEARVRISSLRAPELPVRVGAPIVALAAPEKQATGRTVANPAARNDWTAPYRIPEMETVAATVERWGLAE